MALRAPRHHRHARRVLRHRRRVQKGPCCVSRVGGLSGLVVLGVDCVGGGGGGVSDEEVGCGR